MKSDVEVKAAILNNKIVDWIKRKKNRKFFLFIQYFDPHIPYDPPPPFHETFDYKSDGLDQHIDFLIGREDKRKELLSSIDLYDGEIKYVDDEIGNLIKLLKDLEVYDESLIIFIADHGESLGAHNWQGHELNYEDQIKIPFLIKAPFGTFNNTTVSGQSQNLDLFNFLLDMVDSRVTKENVKQKVEKALDRIKNRAHAFIERRFYTQKSRLQFPHICSKGEEYAVRTKIWKLIHKEKEEDELYNLAQDPYELNNLIEGNSDIVDRLLGLLTSWVATHTTDFKQSEIDKKTEEKLKSLGYIK
jgi:arylsulfatase A-like enzyme